jgi:N-acetylneuraminate synthase/N,N'-diacetyllegionaminate synthase
MTDLFNELTIIAEVGVNHEGSIDKAIELTKLAAEAGANIVKFQSYTTDRFIAAHDEERRKRVEKFALSKNDFLVLFQLCQKLGVGFMSTPVTEDWVEILAPLCPAIKIASGDITFKPVIQEAAKTGKKLLISTGAATIKEIRQAISWVEEIVGPSKLLDSLILMHCVSAYPTPIEEANIRSIPYLKELFGLEIGYSNHVKNLHASLAAVALGAKVIEVHFTDCKEGREFRDHSLSFDPTDLITFISMAKEVEKSLGVYDKFVQKCEMDTIKLIRKGIVAARNLRKGDIISKSDIMYARPAIEFSSEEVEDLIGYQINRNINKGFLIPKSAVKCVV